MIGCSYVCMFMHVCMCVCVHIMVSMQQETVHSLMAHRVRAMGMLREQVPRDSSPESVLRAEGPGELEVWMRHSCEDGATARERTPKEGGCREDISLPLSPSGF